MTKYSKNHQGKTRHISTVLLILSVIAVLSFSGITFSKYMLESNSGAQQATAVEFYFESDQLTETNPPTYQIGYSDTLTIDIRNYLDALNVSAESITYTVTASVVDGDSLTVSDSGSLTFSDGTSEQIDSTIEIDLTSITTTNPTIYVVATATSPYSKTISAYYQIVTDSSAFPTFEVYDVANSNTALIELSSNGYEGTVTMTIPSTVLPNNADTRLTVNSTTSFSIKVAKNSEYQIYVFKTDPSDSHTTNGFSVDPAYND